jgi:multidrug efflux pump subunit AcrB
MVCLIVGGLLVCLRTKQEVFPAFDLDLITISVPYPGASPSEVEKGIVLAIEEGVRGLDGVKKVTATANEGSGTVTVELERGTDGNKALQDVKNAVDRITSFPEEAERPTISLVTSRREIISIVIHGAFGERILRDLAEQVRDELLALPEITQVEVAGVRPPEISIEVPQETLRAYGLTLGQIAQVVRRSAVELPGGAVKTSRGEVLLRTAERRDLGREFAPLAVVSRPDGTQVRLGDIARIRDTFAETDQAAFYNGEPAVMVRVYQTEEQKPIEIARTVFGYVKGLKERVPEGVGVAVWRDYSELYRDRVNLLLRNAGLGLALVLLLLGTFLEVRLAFWVTMGIPISFMGAFLLLPAMSVSINMISLFAFIMALGIVVDDAIVVGENAYEMREIEHDYMAGSIRGARGVSMPVTFSVLTNIVAFMPLFFVVGMAGKIFRVIPAILAPVFAISLIESLFVLPAHLGHQKPARRGSVIGRIDRFQLRFARGLKWVIGHLYAPVLRTGLRWRYLTLAAGAAVLITTLGLVGGRRINFRFFPKVESDFMVARVVLPYGSPVERTREVVRRLEGAAEEVLAEHGGDRVRRGIFSEIGSSTAGGGGPGRPDVAGVSRGNLANVQVYLVSSNEREVSAGELTAAWRQRVGTVPGLESLTFDFSIGPGAGAAINVELSHRDIGTLERAASELAKALGVYTGVSDIDDGFARGKPQLDFRITPEARSVGLTAEELGRQVRDAFYGAEALRQQRGRDEVKVMVRLPERERESQYYLEQLLIRTQEGGEVPLGQAARIEEGYAYTEINRTNGRRVVNVTADVAQRRVSPEKILEGVVRDVLPRLEEAYRGLSWSLEGEHRDLAESMASLRGGFVLALVAIFAMLAIPLKSYVQPLIIMTSIPFGIVGAVAGHFLMGYDLTVISMMGIVALAGVVVNDSLVLIDFANQKRRDGAGPLDAITQAGIRRFRPILLTSLTTFLGLTPMIFETSVQARFLIPMAISLGFGILFSTVITLLLVPSLFTVVEDLKRVFGVRAADEGGAEG